MIFEIPALVEATVDKFVVLPAPVPIIFRPGVSKLSSSSSSTGLFGVIATVSLKHKHAQ